MNALDVDLEGRTVVLRGEGPQAQRRARCVGGFGCRPYTMGRKVFVELPDGRKGYVDGMTDIEAVVG